MKGFSRLSGPLIASIKKNVELVLTKGCEKRFQELKRRLTTTPMLALLESHKPLIIFSNTSKFGMGVS